MTKTHCALTRSTAALACASLCVLAACGGGSSTADTATATGGQQSAASARMTTYITDNLATEYSQVWVGVLKITAIDSAGTEVTLYSTDTASVYNISSLASVGQLMSTVNVPAGVYRQIRVTLADSVKLVSLDGATTVDTAFTGDGSTKTLRVDVSVDTSTDNTLVLDFDLARFTYNASTKLVTPVIVRKDGSATKEFRHNQGEVHGTVVSTDAAANTVTVNDPRLGATTVVKLTTDAVITRESDSSAVTLADLSAGTRIEARGVVTSATTDAVVTVQVSALRVESSTSSSTTAANKLRGEGTVKAVTGNLVTLALSDANFLPANATLVVDISNASFVHGLSSDLTMGAVIAFRGAVDAAASTASSTVIAARIIDVAGGASAKERRDKGSASQVAELKGTVTAISGTTWTVTASSDEHGLKAGTYTVETAQALSKASSGCVVVGSAVEAKGSLTGAVLTAKVVELESNCGASKG